VAHAKVCLFVATALLFGSAADARAQGTADSVTNRNPGVERNATSGGTATTGTGVKTGRGPLSQPIPPAVSTVNPQQNPQRPSNTWGPALTNPPEHPFGSQ
jgi:hypothetical protein